MIERKSIRKLLSILIFFFVINSCSEDEPLATNTTFLDCNENTVWINQDSYTDEITYIRFINDVKILIDVFNKYIPAQMDCFNNFYICQSWGEISIVENTVNKLEFLIYPPIYELNTVEYIFTKSAEHLYLTFSIYDESGDLIEVTESILMKSDVVVDELPICNAE